MIGKWNKSVILTYFGLALSILGILLLILNVDIKYVFICFMYAGICDLFDGTIARRCKRTKEEKQFGIELDSLVDVMSFIALPLVILGTLNKSIYWYPIFVLYGVFAIARLAHYNVETANPNKAIKYYTGLPVTYSSLVFPLVYLLSYIMKYNSFIIVYNIISIVVSILFVSKIKIPKPRIVVSIILVILALALTGIYLFI